ncbi:hypothetical protein PILCRDRAFT_823579 [Piloderma croceum F 1598]|uniref:Uncharacterized protein n=1 Tax=Piloderma croceum (strain F 1598) TaxID=765440 RepID=A0A0C3FHQ6_PILCF|nr:hypothetical protein PILCRDRAFT_823579 [Piloderma croceum F 1598]
MVIFVASTAPVRIRLLALCGTDRVWQRFEKGPDVLKKSSYNFGPPWWSLIGFRVDLIPPGGSKVC